MYLLDFSQNSLGYIDDSDKEFKEKDLYVKVIDLKKDYEETEQNMYLANEDSLKLQEELYLLSKQLKEKQMKGGIQLAYLVKLSMTLRKNLKKHSSLLKELQTLD